MARHYTDTVFNNLWSTTPQLIVYSCIIVYNSTTLPNQNFVDEDCYSNHLQQSPGLTAKAVKPGKENGTHAL